MSVFLEKEIWSERLATPGSRNCMKRGFFGVGGDRSMLMFEVIVLVILGVLAGAELVNVFMLGRLPDSVTLVHAPVVERRTSSNQIM